MDVGRRFGDASPTSASRAFATDRAVLGAGIVSDDTYSGIAERYDRFYGEFGEHDPAVAEFFSALFTEHCVSSVLDCACGTGRHLHLFHVLGCSATGSDVSSAMLAQARRNLAQSGVEAPLLEADYRKLPDCFAQRFDAVVCLSSSILHMPDDDQVVCALRSMREVLRCEGILILTQGTTDKQWREQPRFILAVNNERFSRLFVIDYEGNGARYNILDISHADADWGLEVWSVEYRNVLLRDDYQRLLRVAGYRTVEFYGSYGFDPYDPRESDHLIVVATA